MLSLSFALLASLLRLPPPSQEPRLLETDTVSAIVERAEQLFHKEPTVLTLSSPVVVSGRTVF